MNILIITTIFPTDSAITTVRPICLQSISPMPEKSKRQPKPALMIEESIYFRTVK